MTALERGERVEVRGMNGAVLFVGTVEDASAGSLSVVPDGKTKAKSVSPKNVRRLDVAPRSRAPKARPAITTPPIARRVTTARPELRAQPKPPGPFRSSAYLAFVRLQPCAACRSPKAEPHHWAPTRGAGQKVDDTRTVPLCRACHDHVHAHGYLPHLDVLATRLLILDRQVGLLTTYTRLRAEGAAA